MRNNVRGISGKFQYHPRVGNSGCSKSKYSDNNIGSIHAEARKKKAIDTSEKHLDVKNDSTLLKMKNFFFLKDISEVKRTCSSSILSSKFHSVCRRNSRRKFN